MSIFTVHTALKFPDGTSRYFYVETPHETIAALVDDLRNGPVACTKLRASFDRDRNKMLVSERSDWAIGAGLVVSIEQQNIPFVEAA